MSEPWEANDGDGDGEFDELSDRVCDLEECLSEICERLSEYSEFRKRSGRYPMAAGLADVLHDVMNIIRRHLLGS